MFCLSILSCSLRAWAQEADPATGWYVGVQGGLPFGVSTFSSFGAGKTRVGWNAGMYGGYRFGPVLSAEVSIKCGQTSLAAQSCCIAPGYWMSADGVRHNAPVAGVRGHSYAHLKSSVNLQHYGLQLNFNLLGLFPATACSRWTLEASPLLAAVGTRADILSISGNEKVRNTPIYWHLGAGGNLQAAYRISRHLRAGLYSGITYLTGRRMDGMPQHLHRNNFLWESGLRIGFTFGHADKHSSREADVVAISAHRPPGSQEAPLQLVSAETPVSTEAPVSVETPVSIETSVSAEVPVVAEVSEADVAVVAAEVSEASALQPAAAALTFPVIYFAFNSTRIAHAELGKMRHILSILNQHPHARITITGWCDARGSRHVNARYSLRRAEALKTWLVGNGIDSLRITTRGAGTDYSETDAARARRAHTTHHGKEEQP